MKTVHLAGNDVTIEGRVIQRCLVCGYKLVDIQLSKMVGFSFNKDGAIPDSGRPPVFSVGHLIEVRDGNPLAFLDLGDTKQPAFDAAWDDCCINLVE